MTEYNKEYLHKGFISLVWDALFLYGADNKLLEAVKSYSEGEITVDTIEGLKAANSCVVSELRERLSIFSS